MTTHASMGTSSTNWRGFVAGAAMLRADGLRDVVRRRAATSSALDARVLGWRALYWERLAVHLLARVAPIRA